MINFRYHLVTLIAVFLALALGVVLGAGPLQSRLSNAWTNANSQVSTADISAQLKSANDRLDAQDKGWNALAAKALPGTLDGVQVATVALPGAEESDIQMVSNDIKAAGGTVVGAVTLTRNWESSGMAQYRSSLSGPIASHLGQEAPLDATADGVISFAIMKVLTSSGSEQSLMQEMLSDEEVPIMTVEQDPKGAAQALIVIGPRSASGDQAQSGQQSGAESSSAQAWMGLAQAIAQAPRSGVIWGDGANANTIVAQLRSQDVQVTTVDSVGTAMGALNASLALVDADAQKRAIGVQNGAEQAIAPFTVEK